jgi:peptidoglycan lytic transglycosylase D
MRNLFKINLLSLGVLIFFAGFLNAQDSTATNEQSASPSDPVADMLDSLVTINNVFRYNKLLTDANGEKQLDRPQTFPHYSEQVYAQRISKIKSPINLTYNDQVSRYIDLYAYKKRGLTSRVMGLSQLYFPLFEETLDKEGLPLEFKYLAIVESALNPTAVSRVGATGLWQFMYNTGKIYDLKINSYYDERRDPVKSTYAACRYFKDMYKIYGDWLLVIASYNCGAGNVNKAIRRSGGKTDFWEISKYLPRETRGYVPAFIAVCYVMNYSTEHYIFPVAPAYNYFEVDTVSVKGGISLQKISRAIDLPLDVLAYLNPVYKRGVIPAYQNEAHLRLPIMKISEYIDAENNLFAPLIAKNENDSVLDANANRPFTYEYKSIKKRYRVRSGDNLSVIASRHGCSASKIRKWNHLKSNMIYPGQRLTIYTSQKVKVYFDEPVADEGNIAKKTTDAKSTGDANIKVVYYMVQKGDTLWNIANMYEGVTVEQLKELNEITNIKSLKPGTRLKVKVNG